MSNTHPQLQWLTHDHWVKFDGDRIIQGHHPYAGCSYIISGVEQIDLKRLYEARDIEIWHKKGRMNWEELGRWEYEPAAFLLVVRSMDSIDEYTHYKTLEIVQSGRNYKSTLEQLKAHISAL